MPIGSGKTYPVRSASQTIARGNPRTSIEICLHAPRSTNTLVRYLETSPNGRKQEQNDAAGVDYVRTAVDKSSTDRMQRYACTKYKMKQAHTTHTTRYQANTRMYEYIFSPLVFSIRTAGVKNWPACAAVMACLYRRKLLLRWHRRQNVDTPVHPENRCLLSSTRQVEVYERHSSSSSEATAVLACTRYTPQQTWKSCVWECVVVRMYDNVRSRKRNKK